MPGYVKRIEAVGIHGRFDMVVDLKPGVNIIYGKNGTGKTTLIHILANALNSEFDRFAYLNFYSIKIRFDNATISFQKKVNNDIEELIVKRGNKIVHKVPTIIAKEGRDFPKRFSAKHYRTLEEKNISPRQFRMMFDELFSSDPVLPAAYFPAFRTMIDAWVSSEEARERRTDPEKWTALATRSARKWFGMFIPSINYPSLLEIEERLTSEIQQARFRIGRADREYLSEAFLQIFDSLSEREKKNLDPETILSEIRDLFDRLETSPLQEESTLVTKVYSELRESILDLDFTQESERTAIRVLDVYRDLLRRIVNVQERSFKEIQKYLESVNGFLDNKQLIVDPRVPRFQRGAVGIGFDDGTSLQGLRALSSGERQIVTLIYAATHMSEKKVVLIDEPEISLHVDWQRDLITRMAEQISGQQIIACTHSPVIGAEFEDRQIEIQLKQTKEIILPEDLEREEETILKWQF